jgi:hypothetical protein
VDYTSVKFYRTYINKALKTNLALGEISGLLIPLSSAMRTLTKSLVVIIPPLDMRCCLSRALLASVSEPYNL